MNLELGFDVKTLPNKVGHFFSDNRIIITSLLLLVIGGLVLLRINQLTLSEIDENYKNERLQQINLVEFDEEAIDEITKLNNSDVEVTSDFTDRNNPFVDN